MNKYGMVTKIVNYLIKNKGINCETVQSKETEIMSCVIKNLTLGPVWYRDWNRKLTKNE